MEEKKQRQNIKITSFGQLRVASFQCRVEFDAIVADSHAREADGRKSRTFGILPVLNVLLLHRATTCNFRYRSQSESCMSFLLPHGMISPEPSELWPHAYKMSQQHVACSIPILASARLKKYFCNSIESCMVYLYSHSGLVYSIRDSYASSRCI